MNLLSSLIDFICKIDEFCYYYFKKLIVKPPPIPDKISKLIANNPDIFYVPNPDITSINSYLNECIVDQAKKDEKKLMEKAGSISRLSGLSPKNLSSILYDSKRIIDVKVINWLQLQNKLFILEVTFEIPVTYYKFLKIYKIQKTKKYHYFLNIGLLESTII